MVYGKLQPSFVFVVAIRRDRTLEPCTNRAYLLYMLILMSLECETGKRCSKRATRWVGTSGTSGAMPWWCIELNQKSQHSNSFQTCIELGLHIDFGVHVPIIEMAKKAVHQTRHRFETNVHRSRPGDRKQTPADQRGRFAFDGDAWPSGCWCPAMTAIHPQFYHFYGWYQPSKKDWFMTSRFTNILINDLRLIGIYMTWCLI